MRVLNPFLCAVSFDLSFFERRPPIAPSISMIVCVSLAIDGCFGKRVPCALCSGFECPVEVASERLGQEEQDRPQGGDGRFDSDTIPVGGVSIPFPEFECTDGPSCDEKDRRHTERRHRHPFQQGFLLQAILLHCVALHTSAAAGRPLPPLASGCLLDPSRTHEEASWPRFGGHHGEVVALTTSRSRLAHLHCSGRTTWGRPRRTHMRRGVFDFDPDSSAAKGIGESDRKAGKEGGLDNTCLRGG